MKNKNARFKRILSFVLLLPLAVGMFTPETYAAVNGDGTDVINENYADRLSLQPLAPAFRVETLLRWSPNTDPDASLNRASIPLNTKDSKGLRLTHWPGKLRFILASNGTVNGMKGEVKLLKLKFKAAKVEAATNASISVKEATMGDDTGKETKAAPIVITVQIKPEIVHPGIPGDVNQDGKVSIGDLAMIAANYGSTSASADWERVKHLDVNKDLKIDIEDLVFVASKIIE